MSQGNDLFVYLATSGEAAHIFDGWPEGMAYAVTPHPSEGFEVHLHHESQVEAILSKIARKYEVEASSLRVVPEQAGYQTFQMNVAQELAMLKMVESQVDLVESAEDYMINFEFAQTETPDEVYLADDAEDEDVEDTDDDGEDTAAPLGTHSRASNVPFGDYFVVDEATNETPIVSQPMRLFRDGEGRILLCVPGYRVTEGVELPSVARIHMKVDTTGFFIAVDDLPDEGDGCLLLPYSLVSAGVDLGGSEGRQAKVLTTAQGWHVTILSKVEAPRETPVVKAAPALAPLQPVATPKSRTFLNLVAVVLLAACLIGLGAVGTMFLIPAPAPGQAVESPSLDAPYLDKIRARIYDQQSEAK